MGNRHPLMAGVLLVVLLALGAPRARAEFRPEGADGMMDLPAVEVLSGDVNSTVVALSFPVRTMPKSWAKAASDGIGWPRPWGELPNPDGTTTELPRVAEARLAVPAGCTLQYRVESVDWWVDPVTPVSDDALVYVHGPDTMRDVGLVGVTVQAFVQQVGGNRAIVRRVVVAIDHPTSARQADWLARAVDEPQLRSRAAREATPALVNPEVFTSLRAAAMMSAPNKAREGRGNVPDWFSLSSHWLRLEIDGTGMYQLTGSEMTFMGAVISGIDPGKLRLFHGGGLPVDDDPTLADSLQVDRMGLHEVRIAVQDGGDGEWNADDRIIFYGVGCDTWTDRFDPSAAPLDHVEHPYQSHAVYWLTWEGDADPTPFAGAPRRVEPVAAPAHDGVTPVTEQWARYHGEESVASVPGVLADNWAWYPLITGTQSSPFLLQSVVPTTSARFVADVRGHRAELHAPTYRTRAWLNADQAHADTLVFLYTLQKDSLRVRLIGESDALHSGTNTITISHDSYNTPGNHYPLALDSFDVRYRQALDKRAISGALVYQHFADEVTAPGMPLNVAFTLPASEAATIWDVSMPDSAVALAGDIVAGDPQTVTVGLTRDPTSAAHLVVFSDGNLHAVASGQAESPRALRVAVPPVDYVVVYNSRFRNAAEALADLRGRMLPGVVAPAAAAVSVQEIYDNFSGGQKDMLAIRNFLRWSYYAGGQRLRWACLLGDASVDWRNYLGHDPNSQIYDFITAPLVTRFPLIPDRSTLDHPWTSDETYGCFDLPQADREFDIPDVAIGRIPVTSAAEASAAVNRIITYTETPDVGLWRNRAVFCADDLWQPSDGSGTGSQAYHTDEAEDIALHDVPGSIDMQKVYLVDYPRVGGAKPAAKAELTRQLNRGTTIFYYVGHGAPNNLADEQVFVLADVANLTNGNKRFLFMAFSCDVGIYDDYASQSMGEEFVTSANGGAIASIAASWLSYPSYNDQLSEGIFADIYPTQRVDENTTLGESLRVGKAGLWAQIGANLTIRNARRYNLFGDPATHLPNPVDDLAFAPTSMDSLLTGRPHQVVLDLADQGLAASASATYDLNVEESGVDVLYYSGSTGDYYWRRAGNTAFHGTGAPANDPLIVPFLAPLQMRRGDLGRVRLVVNDGSSEQVAEIAVPVVGASANSGGDVAGPQIQLAFGDGLVRVPTGSSLQAVISDTSGVNTLGSNPGNSVLLEFDGSGIYSDVSDQFAFDAGSYTRGRLQVALPSELGLGQHRVALLASDMFGNVGSDTLGFELVASVIPDIYDVSVFPNPTAGPCRLLCDVSEPMALRWDIYTVAGHCIRTIRADGSAAGPKILAWDGRDGEGDGIANGVYLYVLRGTAAADAAHEIRKTGQLVIMR